MPNLSQLQFTAYLKVFDFVQPLCFHLCFLNFPPLLPSSLISFLSLPAHASLPSVPSNSSPHSPSEIYQCWRGCARRVKRAGEHDTHSLKRGVIGPVQSHSDNISVSIPPLPLPHTHAHTDTHTDTQTHPLPRKLPVLRGCVWGMSRAGEHDMLIKREVIGLVHSNREK